MLEFRHLVSRHLGESVHGLMVLIKGGSLSQEDVPLIAKQNEIRLSIESAITDKDCEILAEVLQITTTLETLDSSYTRVIALRNSKFMEALAKNRTIKTLRLARAWCDDEDAKALAAVLKENSTIDDINLFVNHIGAEGAAALAKALKTNATLQTINLSWNDEIGDEGAKALAAALKVNSSLRHMNLSFNEISAVGATAMAEALTVNSSLQELYLCDNQIGGEGAKALAAALKENKSLTKIDLYDNEIGVDGASALADALKENKTLDRINLDYNKIGDGGAASLADALKDNKSLTKIELGFNQIGDDGAKSLAEALKVNSSLQELNLHDNKISAEGAAALAAALKANPSLQELNLDYNKIGDDEAKALADALKDNKSLTKIELDCNQIGTEGAKALAAALKVNSSLRHMNLSRNEISDVGAAAMAEALKVNSSLQELNLRESNIGDEGAAALADALKVNSSLQTLDLDDNKIGEKGGKDILNALQHSGNSTLESINLRWNQVTMETMNNIEDLAGDREIRIIRQVIRTVAVNEGQVAAEDLAGGFDGDVDGRSNNACEGQPTADAGNVYLSGNRISVRGAEFLVGELYGNVKLQTIDLSDNEIGDEGAMELAYALDVNFTLQMMNLSMNGIGDRGAGAFAKALKENTTLRTIFLNDNKIGHAGAEALAVAMQQNDTLQTMNMGGNIFGDDGAKALAEGLNDTSLHAMDLSYNGIGDKGAKAFADALKNNATLEAINLKNNSITDDGARSLAESLKCNHCIEDLALDRNSIKEQGARDILDALNQNGSIRTLGLEGNQINGETLEKVHTAVRDPNRRIVATRVEILAQKRALSVKDLDPYTLAAVLETTTTLTNLRLHNSTVLHDDCFCSALAKNCTVKTLNLTRSGCGDEGAIALAAIMKVNTTMTRLGLGYNIISDTGIQSLATALLHRCRCKEDDEITELTMNLRGNNLLTDEVLEALGFVQDGWTTAFEIDIGDTEISDGPHHILGNRPPDEVVAELIRFLQIRHLQGENEDAGGGREECSDKHNECWNDMEGVEGDGANSRKRKECISSDGDEEMEIDSTSPSNGSTDNESDVVDATSEPSYEDAGDTVADEGVISRMRKECIICEGGKGSEIESTSPSNGYTDDESDVVDATSEPSFEDAGKIVAEEGVNSSKRKENILGTNNAQRVMNTRSSYQSTRRNERSRHISTVEWVGECIFNQFLKYQGWEMKTDKLNVIIYRAGCDHKTALDGKDKFYGYKALAIWAFKSGYYKDKFVETEEGLEWLRKKGLQDEPYSICGAATDWVDGRYVPKEQQSLVKERMNENDSNPYPSKRHCTKGRSCNQNASANEGLLSQIVTTKTLPMLGCREPVSENEMNEVTDGGEKTEPERGKAALSKDGNKRGAECAELEMEPHQLRGTVEMTNEQVDDGKKLTIDKLLKEKTELEQKLQTLTKAAENERERMADETAQLKESLAAEKSNSAKEEQKRNAMSAQFENEMSKLRGNVMMLTKKLDDEKQLNHDLTKREAALEATVEKERKCDAEITRLKELLEEKQSTLSREVEDKARLQESVERCEKQNQVQIEKIKDSGALLQEALNEKAKSIKELSKVKADLEGSKAALVLAVENERQVSAKMSKELQEKSALKMHFERVKRENDELKAYNTKMQKELDEKGIMIDELTKSKTELESRTAHDDLSHLKDDVSHLKDNMSDVKASLHLINRLSNKRDELEVKVSDLEKESARMKTECDCAEHKMKEFEDANAALQMKLDEQKEEVQKLRAKARLGNSPNRTAAAGHSSTRNLINKVKQLKVEREKSDAEKSTLRGDISKLKQNNKKLKAELNKSKSSETGMPQSSGGGGTGAKPKAKGGEGGEAEDDPEGDKRKLRQAISDTIVKGEVKWDDVIGLEKAKGTLELTVTDPIKQPQIFTGSRQPFNGILLYGPPGTGKSYLAHAVATEVEGTFFSVTSSDIVSKWQGQSARLVRTLFEMARECPASKAVIFIDEIDALCRGRSETENDCSRGVKTELLTQMDGVIKRGCGDGGNVLVLGATNLPWELDAAFQRRFQQRVYIPLPEQDARAKMVKFYVGDTPNCFTDDDYDELGELTEGVSGSDIKALVNAASMEPMRRSKEAQRFQRVDDSFMACEKSPCPNCPEEKHQACKKCKAVKLQYSDIPNGKLMVPDFSMVDFTAVLQRQSPSSVSTETLEKYNEWTKDFGADGS